MAVVIRFSGGASNGNPAGSLGGIMSSVAVTSATLHNLFDQITRTEALAGRTEFRCFYVFNEGPGTVTGVTIEFSTNPAVTRLSIGLDSAGKGDGSATGVATSISTEDTTPSNVKFWGEDTLSADGPYDTVRLPIGLLKSGEGVPVWIKRVTEQGGNQTLSANVKIKHDAVTLPGETYDDGGAIGEFYSVTLGSTSDFVIGTARVGFSEVVANP